MDKTNPSVRRYLAERAELLGAVRLPNNAFKENAGTEVTADILFLRKRERSIAIKPEAEPGWVRLDKTEDGVPVNSYFASNPHMVLGKMVRDKSMYGSEDETACIPFEGMKLQELLEKAIGGLDGKILDYRNQEEREEGQKEKKGFPADSSVRKWSFALMNGEVYFREDFEMYKVELKEAEKKQMKGLLELKERVRTLIDVQLQDYPDEVIGKRQADLSESYDGFTARYGLVNGRTNARLFEKDSAYPLLCSLEVLDEDGKLKGKADIFTQRTIRRCSPPQSVETPAEALAVSLAEKARVDLDYMSKLTGMEREKVIEELRSASAIFANPQKKDAEGRCLYETADEYLSGDVRQKLALAEHRARSEPEIFAVNVAALKEAQPQRIEAGDINVRLGAAWIGPKYVQEFMYELLDTPRRLRTAHIGVEYSKHTGEWHVSGQNAGMNNMKASVTYGTARVNAYKLIENILNFRDARVYDVKRDEEGRERNELNYKETVLAQTRQKAVKEAFGEWIFKDPERREILVEQYNTLFNSTRPREYDGSHLVFPGMSPTAALREHQTAAVARILYGGNTLLAHAVGAGKSATRS